MSRNSELGSAKTSKKDEFYTSLYDIEIEMKNYKNFFKDKVVLCNCDDPYESNFFKYFAINFNYLQLKKLICTCYDGSPVVGEQLNLFDLFDDSKNDDKKAYKIEINQVLDFNGDGAVDMSDIDFLLKNNKNSLTLLNGNGDFRSEECIKNLIEADVVVTNPPFSLFREYLAQLIKYDKKFIILGNVNAITYKEVSPLIRDNKLWMGQSIHSGDREFRVPDDYPLKASGYRIDEKGKKYIRVKGVRWWTNVDYSSRHELMTLYKNYSEASYPKYANFNAINVDNTSEIPCDYDGIMGVPITFLDKYNPDQFEILAFTNDVDWQKQNHISPLGEENFKRLRNQGNMAHVTAGMTTIYLDINGFITLPYCRILIRRKK